MGILAGAISSFRPLSAIPHCSSCYCCCGAPMLQGFKCNTSTEYTMEYYYALHSALLLPKQLISLEMYMYCTEYGVISLPKYQIGHCYPCHANFLLGPLCLVRTEWTHAPSREASEGGLASVLRFHLPGNYPVLPRPLPKGKRPSPFLHDGVKQFVCFLGLLVIS